MNINDKEFDRQINLREAYLVMLKFLEQYVSRGDTSVVELISFMWLHPNGGSGDPAMLDDYLNSANEVMANGPVKEGGS